MEQSKPTNVLFIIPKGQKSKYEKFIEALLLEGFSSSLLFCIRECKTNIGVAETQAVILEHDFYLYELDCGFGEVWNLYWRMFNENHNDERRLSFYPVSRKYCRFVFHSEWWSGHYLKGLELKEALE